MPSLRPSFAGNGCGLRRCEDARCDLLQSHWEVSLPPGLAEERPTAPLENRHPEVPLLRLRIGILK